jgi:prepilin-type N-terminal cleavage/methylation domain-containing protein
MSIQYIHCLLSRYRKNIGQSGFTLLELLIVMTLISVLSAIALPHLLGQVGKARESEAKNIVSSVNRAQQAFHFEKQTFADGTTLTNADNELGVVVTPDFYAFSVTGTATTAEVAATALNATEDAVRNYAGGISYASGSYTTALCQSDTVGGTATASGSNCIAGTELN